MNATGQTASSVFKPSMADNFAFLFNCSAMSRASHCMTVAFLSLF